MIIEEIEETLYDLSQGIPDILVKLFILTQMRTLASSSDLVRRGRPPLMYRDIILAVYDDYFGDVKPITEILRSNDSKRMAKIADLSWHVSLEQSFENAMKLESVKINENSAEFPGEAPDQKLLLAGMTEQYLLSMKVAVTDDIRGLIKEYLAENDEAAIRDTVSAVLDYLHH